MRKTAVLGLLSLCACGAGGQSQQPMTQPPASRAGPVVFLGDSITQLCPWDTYVPGAINAGVSSNETSQMLARFDTDVLAHLPSVLVLLGGTNDIRHLDSADVANITAIVARAKAADIRVIVGTLPPADLNLGAYPEVELQLFSVFNDKIVKGAAAAGYDVVDYHDAMSLGSDMDRSLYADQWLHPNAAGCAAMFQQLEPILTQLRT